MNSRSHHKEYLRFDRWRRNARRFPAQLASRLQTEGGRLSLFQDWVACKGNNTAILARHQQTLTEAKNSKVKYGFRGEKYLIDTHGEKKAQNIIARKKQLGLTIEDPEDSDDLLYFVLINIDINNINELKRTTSLEIAGQVDQEILKAFTEAPFCFFPLDLSAIYHLCLPNISPFPIHFSSFSHPLIYSFTPFFRPSLALSLSLSLRVLSPCSSIYVLCSERKVACWIPKL